ncbi:MAG: ribosome maturation factor RimM [Nitrospinota bacterium]|nr:ribosome maturation factor RimM [Nitrospinota bacterium]
MDWVPVGYITKTHGLKGEVKLRPVVIDPNMVQGARRTRIVGGDGSSVETELEKVRGQGGRWIVKFKDFKTIEQAEQDLVGRSVEIYCEDFRSLPEGEYYWFQIEGLQVFDEEGRYYGTVNEIIVTGSNDVYVVQDGDKELLLPMIDSVVKSIDLKENKLIFHIIEGLLEDYPV